MEQQLINVARFGTYYNPASKHYGRDGNVTCDKCHAKSLTACIGYADKDLCLPCTSILNASYPCKAIKRGQFGEIRTLMQSNTFDVIERGQFGEIRTYMQSNTFDVAKSDKYDDIRTLMESDEFD